MCPEVNYKSEAQRQWNADPCGAVTAGDAVLGSREFFDRVEEERYGRYAPWMKSAIPFALQRGKRVLEIGPGLGTDHIQFARAGAELYAVDLTHGHLELTLQRFLLEGQVTRLIRGDAEVLPFSDDSFDMVYSFGVLHHTPGTEQAINEVHRVLRPEGIAVIAMYHKHSAFYWIHTILIRGFLLGGLFSRGYGRLLSEIEYRSDPSTAIPLVKVYSRRQCRELFKGFRQIRSRTDHFELAHVIPFLPHWRGRLRRIAEQLGRRWGWYITVFAEK
jgi:ubiquinone/menaquinone biosynthesis C-methylase UbiE